MGQEKDSTPRVVYYLTVHGISTKIQAGYALAPAVRSAPLLDRDAPRPLALARAQI